VPSIAIRSDYEMVAITENVPSPPRSGFPRKARRCGSLERTCGEIFSAVNHHWARNRIRVVVQPIDELFSLRHIPPQLNTRELVLFTLRGCGILARVLVA
jgi:hypothetical protein